MKYASLLFALPVWLAPSSACADTPIGVWFAGGTVSESSSAYAGGVVSLPGHSLGHGVAFRLGLSAGKYKYDAGPTRITAKYAGAEAALVYQFSGKWGWANLSAGPKFSHTDLSPVDPNNKLQGSRWDLGLQTDGALDGARWRLGWFGSYGIANEAYQAKLQLSRKIGKTDVRLGLETGIQGDPTYKKGLVGGFIGKTIGRNLELQVGGGITEQRGRGPRAYGSLSLSQIF